MIFQSFFDCELRFDDRTLFLRLRIDGGVSITVSPCSQLLNLIQYLSHPISDLLAMLFDRGISLGQFLGGQRTNCSANCHGNYNCPHHGNADRQCQDLASKGLLHQIVGIVPDNVLLVCVFCHLGIRLRFIPGVQEPRRRKREGDHAQETRRRKWTKKTKSSEVALHTQAQ